MCLSMQYHNIFALVKELGIPNPFTRWTPSGFWSPTGLTTQVHHHVHPLRIGVTTDCALLEGFATRHMSTKFVPSTGAGVLGAAAVPNHAGTVHPHSAAL
jgi:hypothetical protein